jgi:hypothetical protein
MSLLIKTMLEAERDSALDFMQAVSRDGGLQVILREEGLRAAMQAAARQTNTKPPVRQQPSVRRDLRVNSAGRIDRPAGPGTAGPVRPVALPRHAAFPP